MILDQHHHHSDESEVEVVAVAEEVAVVSAVVGLQDGDDTYMAPDNVCMSQAGDSLEPDRGR